MGKQRLLPPEDRADRDEGSGRGLAFFWREKRLSVALSGLISGIISISLYIVPRAFPPSPLLVDCRTGGKIRFRHATTAETAPSPYHRRSRPPRSCSHCWVLSQKDEKGKSRPISFSSRTLRGAELNYGRPEKEVMAALEARPAKHHIQGYHQNSLQRIFCFKKTTSGPELIANLPRG